MAAASKARRTPSRARSDTKTSKPIEPEAEAESPEPKLATKSVASAAKPKATASTPAKAAPARRTRAKPDVLVQRVYNTIDGELTKLEKQKGLTSQDRERASRALSQMVNALEKAVEMQRVMTKRKPTGGDAKSKEALAHAEDLRREIAERLERLNRKRSPQRSSE
ncbi:MAG: hypothetical protein J0I81_00960 [Hyphomicrobium sp.]|nr:hypothetical protein [Hyphomicrobium sp.]